MDSNTTFKFVGWHYLITFCFKELIVLSKLRQCNHLFKKLVDENSNCYQDAKQSFSIKKGTLVLNPNRLDVKETQLNCYFKIIGFINSSDITKMIHLELIMKKYDYEILYNYVENYFISANFSLAIKDGLSLTDFLPDKEVDFMVGRRYNGFVFYETPRLREEEITPETRLNRVVKSSSKDWENSWLNHFIYKKNCILNQVYFEIVLEDE
jgi:hypothetical protein